MADKFEAFEKLLKFLAEKAPEALKAAEPLTKKVQEDWGALKEETRSLANRLSGLTDRFSGEQAAHIATQRARAEAESALANERSALKQERDAHTATRSSLKSAEEKLGQAHAARDEAQHSLAQEKDARAEDKSRHARELAAERARTHEAELAHERTKGQLSERSRPEGANTQTRPSDKGIHPLKKLGGFVKKNPVTATLISTLVGGLAAILFRPVLEYIEYNTPWGQFYVAMTTKYKDTTTAKVRDQILTESIQAELDKRIYLGSKTYELNNSADVHIIKPKGKYPENLKVYLENEHVQLSSLSQIEKLYGQPGSTMSATPIQLQKGQGFKPFFLADGKTPATLMEKGQEYVLVKIGQEYGLISQGDFNSARPKQNVSLNNVKQSPYKLANYVLKDIGSASTPAIVKTQVEWNPNAPEHYLLPNPDQFTAPPKRPENSSIRSTGGVPFAILSESQYKSAVALFAKGRVPKLQALVARLKNDAASNNRLAEGTHYIPTFTSLKNSRSIAMITDGKGHVGFLATVQDGQYAGKHVLIQASELSSHRADLPSAPSSTPHTLGGLKILHAQAASPATAVAQNSHPAGGTPLSVPAGLMLAGFVGGAGGVLRKGTGGPTPKGTNTSSEGIKGAETETPVSHANVTMPESGIAKTIATTADTVDETANIGMGASLVTSGAAKFIRPLATVSEFAGRFSGPLAAVSGGAVAVADVARGDYVGAVGDTAGAAGAWGGFATGMALGTLTGPFAPIASPVLGIAFAVGGNVLAKDGAEWVAKSYYKSVTSPDGSGPTRNDDIWARAAAIAPMM